MATKLDTVVSVILDASGMVVGVKNANGQIRNLQGQFIKLKDDMQLVEKGTERFATAMAQATQRANKSIKDSTNQMTSFKGVLENMFKPITALNQAFGVIQQSLYVVQRAFALTVGSAAELELQVARITTVLDASEVGQVDFAKRILDMQRTFGANPTEAAKGFYEAIASGATNAAGSIDLMATAQKLAVGGLLPLDKALSGLTAVMASYGYEANQTRYISDGFFIAAAKGKTNVEELTMEIGNVSAIAQQANVSFEELVSSVSAVTLGGKRTAEATTSVRSAINALLTPTEQLQYVYNQLGINSVTAAIKQRGLQAVYQDIYKYVNFNVEALSKLVGRIEAVPAVVALTTGKQKAAYNDMLSSITNSTKKMGDTTERAFNIIAQTSAHKMEVAKGSISASLTGISQAFTVILTPLVEVGAKILSSILKPIELASSAFVTFSKSVTNYVIPAVTALTVAFAAIKIPALVSVLTPLAVAFKAVAIPAAIVAGKFLLISAAVVGISALIDSIIKNFNLIPTVFDLVISKFDEFRIYLEQKLYSILSTLVGFGNDLAKNFPEFAKSIGLKFNVDGVKKHVDDLSSELDKAVQNTLGVKEKLSREFKGGAFKAIGEGVKSFIEGMKGADIPPQLPSMPGMPKPPKTGDQKEAPDIKKAMEEGEKATEQLNAILGGTVDLEKEIALSRVYGNDVLSEGLKYDLQRLDAISQSADAYEKLSSKQLKAIDNYKIKAAEAIEIKINTENLKTAADFVNSAMGGAESLVTKSINEIGKMFGPEGQLIASVINLLRQGKDFMSKLGSDLIKIIVELPLKVAEGAVGLVEGILQGILDMLGDPARLAKIFTTLQTIAPKIVTAIAKALPGILKILLDPAFWLEFAKQLVRSIWDAFKEMFIAIGDLFASIFSGGIFDGIGKSVEDMGNSIGDGIRDATKAITGFTEQLFGVQEDVTGGAGQDQGSPIKKAFDYGAKKTKSVWRDIMKFVVDTFNLVKQILTNPFQLFMITISATMELLSSIIDGGMSLFAALSESLIMTVESAGNILASIFSTIWDSGKIVFEGVVGLFSNLWNTFKNVFTAVFNFGKSIFSGVIDSFKAVFTFFRNVFDDPIAALKQFLADFKNIFSNIWDAFKEIPMKLWEGIKNGASIVWDTFKQLGARIWEGLKEVFGEIGTWFKGIGTKIYEGFSEMFDKIADGFRNFGRNIWEGFKQIIKDTVGRLADWLGLAEGGIVPGMALVSGDSAKNDVVPALLSPGEAVIPRSLMANPEINKMISDLLNNRQIPVSYDIGLPRMAFANGGIVPAISGSSGTVFGDTNINVVMKIDSKEPIDEAFLRQRLVPALKAELKASSLRGDFVLSAKGVRS